MGKMGKLSDFGQSPSTPVPPVEPQESETNVIAATETVPTQIVVELPVAPSNQNEITVNVNIKMSLSQQEWLAATAKAVRRNNPLPVPAKERVYPQHLIGLAVELLQAADVDWDEVKTIEELRSKLISAK
jgi:hypothetical protein